MTAVDVPAALARSPLYAQRGVMLIRGWLGESTVRALLGEARALRADAARGTVAASDGTEGRGGSPARDFVSAPSGPVHWELHRCAPMLAALARLCGNAVSVTGSGTYSYYERPGDFLAVHRDIDACDVAVITCLADDANIADAAAGADAAGLVVYPDLVGQPLSAVRAAGRSRGATVPLTPGDTAVLLGGLVPHEVLPVHAERVVSIMCYRMAEPGAAS